MQSEYDDPIANFRSALSVIQIEWCPSADNTKIKHGRPCGSPSSPSAYFKKKKLVEFTSTGLHTSREIRDSSVSIVSRLQAGRQRNLSILRRDKRFSLEPIPVVRTTSY